jgi:siroheme synthase
VTHREVSSGVLVVSGHDEDRFVRQVSSVPPHELTIVVLMGYSVRARLARRAIEAGWRPSTPVAIVSGASRVDADVWSATLGELADVDASQDDAEQPPATIVIGDVTRVRHELTDLAISRSGDLAVSRSGDLAISHSGNAELIAVADRAEVCHG